MALFQVLRQLEPAGEKWRYVGRITHNAKQLNVSGIVSDYPTNSQIKRAIIRDVKRQVKKYLASLAQPQTKTLSSDSIFKDVLS